ncbi:MAG: LuxR C-terminal-related transcriptional regulator [Candidatus Eremiobacteraeota bacterium]|nr:LuxR C-terminal-related transcriptional regulator [Candidatus Eremiobacteraeota bacterium]
MIAFGLTNTAIAERLEVGEKTIEKHISHIFRKLNVTSRAQVAVHVVAPDSHFFGKMRRDKV